MIAYTYILRCADDTLYTGWTNDLEKRLRAHNSGRGSKYTRARLPVVFAHVEMFQTKEQAQHRECEIKRLSREEKLELIDKDDENNL